MGGLRSRIQKRSRAGASDTAINTRSMLMVKAPTTAIHELDFEIKETPRVPSAGVPRIDLRQTGTHKVSSLVKTLTQSRARPVHHAVTNKRMNSSALLAEGAPPWINHGRSSSQQVDVLVPAARTVLNEVLTDKSSKSDLPILIRKAVNMAVSRLAGEIRFAGQDVEDAISDLTSLMCGKGPLEALYEDPAITDIYIDGHKSIKCIRRGQAMETPFFFRSPDEYEAYIGSLLQGIDRVLNLSSPIVDCVLNDSYRSRINAVHSSLLDSGESSVVIRVPRLQQISFYDILQTTTLPATVAAWLAEVVVSGEANILVCGATGSGKTVMTTALLSAVGPDERICTIEDVPEIFVPSVHLEKLVSRPENSQGEGEVQMDKLLRAALRRAPHRIVVGEIRDKEGSLFLKALETGHAGSVATIHAKTPKEALWRLLDVVAAQEKAPQESIQRRISRSVDLIVALKRINGRPALVDISEVRPPVNGEFVVKQLVRYEGEINGKRNWRVMANHSNWLDRLREAGIELEVGPALLPLDKEHEVEHPEGNIMESGYEGE